MRIDRKRLAACTFLSCLMVSLLASAHFFGQQPQVPPPLIKENTTVRVSAHVWVIPDGNVPVVPNVGIIVGDHATLVVDPGLGMRNGQAVLREVAKVSKNTDMYVTSTHFHPEHSSGVAAFPAGAKYVVSKIQQQDLNELAPAMAAQFAVRTPAMADLLKGVQFRRADITFEKQYDLDLGGVKVQLLSMGPTHTRGDTAIWAEGEGVIFAGDVVMNRTVVAYGQYSSAKAWIDALAQLARLRSAEEENSPVLVPSHGAVGTANLIAYQRGFFQGIQQRVREYKDQGKFDAEIISAVTAEMKSRYSMWAATDRIDAIVKNVVAEMK